MSNKKCKITFPVIMVVSAICYIYITTVFVFIDRWFGLFTSPGLMNAVVFTAIAALCIFNYAVAIIRDPGRVPISFVPDIENDNSVQEVKRKICVILGLPFVFGYVVGGFKGVPWSDFKSGDLRFCQKCSHYKPPRAHHCRVCRRCILRMDHHCIWINNCVGHANYKVFFVFVLYAVIACIYSGVLLLGSILSDTATDEQQNEGSWRTVYVVSSLLIFPLTIALGVLLGWHIYLTLRNKTTIEYYEGVRAMWLAEKGGEVYRHPYDLGAFDNLTSVLGPNILSWICPTSGHIGSGLRFPTVYDKLTGPLSE